MMFQHEFIAVDVVRKVSNESNDDDSMREIEKDEEKNTPLVALWIDPNPELFGTYMPMDFILYRKRTAELPLVLLML